MRTTAAGLAITAMVSITTPCAVSTLLPATAFADPASCDEPACVPGIAPGAVIGAPCENTAYFVFATTSSGRLVFCGSPRRYVPRYFRSPPMAGIKELDSPCPGMQYRVAQAPDGLFLSCQLSDAAPRWERADT